MHFGWCSLLRLTLAIATDRVIAAFRRRLFKAETAPFLKVLLMVFLCSVEFLGRQNLSYNLPVQEFLLTLQRLLCCIFLLRCVEVYTRSVLRPHIISLPTKDYKAVSICKVISCETKVCVTRSESTKHQFRIWNWCDFSDLAYGHAKIREHKSWYFLVCLSSTFAFERRGKQAGVGG